MMPMPKTELLMANEPTMQNIRMIGIRMLVGTRSTWRATLISTQPSGSMMRLARKKTMKTA